MDTVGAADFGSGYGMDLSLWSGSSISTAVESPVVPESVRCLIGKGLNVVEGLVLGDGGKLFLIFFPAVIGITSVCSLTVDLEVDTATVVSSSASETGVVAEFGAPLEEGNSDRTRASSGTSL